MARRQEPIADLGRPFSAGLAAAAWRPLCPGVEIATILKDRGRDYSVAFLRFQPGARAMRHIHPMSEQYFLVEGSLVDGDLTIGPGTFVNHPPGSVHEPYSPTGATIMVTWFGQLDAY